MKIEKVNDNQIRCTLTKDDLISRHIRLSELAYGSEKAKSLFRDMMAQANFEFGFEAEDIPLMIEAIPLNAESLVLIITKVEDPEELDTRFARFAPSVEDEVSEVRETAKPQIPLDLSLNETGRKKKVEVAPTPAPGRDVRIFRFSSVSDVVEAARHAEFCDEYSSSLYKESQSGSFLLTMTPAGGKKSTFDMVCNLLSEYGTYVKDGRYTPSYLEEHCKPYLLSNALGSLRLSFHE